MNNGPGERHNAADDMTLVISLGHLRQRGRIGETTQHKPKGLKCQDEGNVLLVKSPCTYWFSRHTIVLVCPWGVLSKKNCSEISVPLRRKAVVS